MTYGAPAGCPGERAFLEMVGRDGGHFVLVPRAQPARSFRVHIEGDGPVTGGLVVRDRDGNEATREMSGALCDDVVRALAVLFALSIEPPATTPAEPRTPETPGLAPPDGADGPGPPASGPPEGLPPVPGLAAGRRHASS